MNNKCDQIMLMITEWDTDVAFISITWLTDQFNVTTATIRSHGYELEHSEISLMGVELPF